MTPEERKEARARCEAATPGPWHYYPCGDKSNDCLLGVAFGDKGEHPPPGKVELHPYDEKRHDYEMDKYTLDPVIASCEDHADYNDFDFIAHARTDLPAALDEIDRLEKAIRKHRDYRGDDRCWLDDRELYAALPEGYTPRKEDVAVELERCQQFIRCRHDPETVYVSPQVAVEKRNEMIMRLQRTLLDVTRIVNSVALDGIAFLGYKEAFAADCQCLAREARELVKGA